MIPLALVDTVGVSEPPILDYQTPKKSRPEPRPTVVMTLSIPVFLLLCWMAAEMLDVQVRGRIPLAAWAALWITAAIAGLASMVYGLTVRQRWYVTLNSYASLVVLLLTLLLERDFVRSVQILFPLFH